MKWGSAISPDEQVRLDVPMICQKFRPFRIPIQARIGLVSQVTAEGQALQAARSTAAQIKKFDSVALIAAKRFIKPIPYDELNRELEIASELFTRNALIEGLRKFVENKTVFPYLP